jgi:HK97 family phage portal protein
VRALDALAGLVSRSVEDPSQPLTGSTLLSQMDSAEDMWGVPGKVSGDPLRIGTALRCVQILASTVAGCPLHVREETTHKPVSIAALEAKRIGTTPFELWETTVAHLALRGNAFHRKVRSRDGRLVNLVGIHPSRVKVDVDDGPAAADVGMPWVKKFTVDGRVPLTEWDLMHIPGLSMDGVTGLSVITQLRRTFELASASEATASRLFEKGMLQTGYLSTDADLTEEKSNIIKARWRAKVSGVDNAYDVPVMDKGLKFEQLSMNPADAQFLETRKFSATEIARIFGIPGWMVNDQEKSTSWGSGMEQQFIAFVIVTLKPYFQRIEQRVTREICDPRAEKAEFKVEGLLRGDSKARAAFYASGVQHGWLVPNDIRPLEDMPPVPWGDVPYRPYNQSAASQTDDDTEPGGEDDDDDDA